MKPVYLSIKEKLVADIDAGKIKVGDKLPSEKEMSKIFGVSRETFRVAIKLLEKEGRIIVKHGAGTFVVNPLPSIPHRLESLSSVTDMIESAGLKEGEKRESLQVESCDDEIASLLHIGVGESILLHERIRTADEEPVVVSKNYLPVKLVGEKILEEKKIGSLFLYLERQCNIIITKADSELVVPLHTDKSCQKLLVNPVSTVVLLKQTHYDQNHKPVLYSLDYFRNDIFRFWIRRSR